MPPLTIRPFEEGDIEAVLALHNRSFDGHPARSSRHWHWKFRENPLGDTEMTVAMAADGGCAGVYAVVPHRAVVKGEEARAGLQTDMAVDPTRRSGLGGSRLIIALGRLYQETFVVGKKELEWGFPEPQLQRVCIKHLGVGVLRDVVFVAREPAGLPDAPGGIDVTNPKRCSPDVDALWERCAGEIGTGTVRDAAYLNWRYADHPDVDHVFFEARSAGAGGELRGIAVAREGGWDERLFSIMDWLVPRDDREAEAALVHAVQAEAARRERPYVAAWFPTPSQEFHRFQVDHGFFAKSTPFQECYRSWVKGAGRRWLDEHWYQTMGDIEFF